MKLMFAFTIVIVTMLSSYGVAESVNASNTVEISKCNVDYPEQSTSLYILPYSVNSAYIVGQGNCTEGSHEINSSQAYSYDFDMPIGTDIVASRQGYVVTVVDEFLENNNTPNQENYIIIKHDDSTISGYYHLTQDGVIVGEGSFVAQGDIIGQSGNTGNSSEPHLHFEVAVCEDCETLPINFINTRAHKNGLVDGELYEAKLF